MTIIIFIEKLHNWRYLTVLANNFAVAAQSSLTQVQDTRRFCQLIIGYSLIYQTIDNLSHNNYITVLL